MHCPSLQPPSRATSARQVAGAAFQSQYAPPVQSSCEQSPSIGTPATSSPEAHAPVQQVMAGSQSPGSQKPLAHSALAAQASPSGTVPSQMCPHGSRSGAPVSCSQVTSASASSHADSSTGSYDALPPPTAARTSVPTTSIASMQVSRSG